MFKAVVAGGAAFQVIELSEGMTGVRPKRFPNCKLDIGAVTPDMTIAVIPVDPIEAPKLPEKLGFAEKLAPEGSTANF